MRLASICWIVLLACVLTYTEVSAQSGAAYLGTQLAPLTPDLASRFGNGALIVGVTPGSPAANAGLKRGEIIVQADGDSVESPQDVVDTVQDFDPGETLQLKVVDLSHGFNTRDIRVTLLARPGAAVVPSPQKKGRGKTDDGIYHGFDDFKAPPEQRNVNPQTGLNALPLGAQNGGTSSMAMMGGRAGNLIPMQLLQGQYCRALAPAGWRVVDEEAQGRAATFASADQRMKALYAITGINGGAAQGYYGPQGATPAGNVQFLASTVAGQPLQAVGLQNFMGAQVLRLQGQGIIGFGVFQTGPLIADPQGFLLLMRVALADSQQDQGIAGAVASTIRCNAQFRPPAGGYAQVAPRSPDKATGTSTACQSGNCDDSDLAGTYNAQLGTGYVHSATGQNYLVDPSTDYHQTGPDGPGYYRQVGNSLEKLTPGWSE